MIVSILASALTAAAVYLLCRRYADRALAIVVALGAASAPLVWTYSEVAMPYALLGLLSVVLAATLRDARSRPWPAALMVSPACLAAEAVRRSCGSGRSALVLLAHRGVTRPLRRRHRIACLLVRTSLVLSGGPAAYLASLGGQASRVSELSPAAGSDALLRNTLLTVYALWWGLLGFALLLLAAIVAALTARRRLSDDTMFFALWLIPAGLVYVTIHIGDPGYLMSRLPGLYVAVAALLAPLARLAPRAAS